METLSEFLKSKENQSLVLERVISRFRSDGIWGAHGLFAKIGKETGISPAYVGRSLTGKNRLTDSFVEKIANYLRVSVADLRGGKDPVSDVCEGDPKETLVWRKGLNAGLERAAEIVMLQDTTGKTLIQIADAIRKEMTNLTTETPISF